MSFSKRAMFWTASLILAALLLAAALYARAMRPQLELGTGYAARVACACRYIGNRPLQQCYKDFEPGMEMIRLSENAADKSVTASVPLLAHRTARFDPLLGCQPEPFKGRDYVIRR
ncbi:hypothetical protein SCH01S_40_00420 [Sphingomonas changbaiensis NBRC 104936]|uniref:Uncharacterized protein n=1 Tax=Sphingomonas changbaiensis NBRC 104936 TaxID=1219043 RepID=A0A0E9MS48_9SPHN|nr:hypothetical protein [Sphingomonas changbaiensis]GAO39945.1 hypothetical protein SCH01S_40_00420 [Sphingomonas changbaiensis NBRC 104936]